MSACRGGDDDFSASATSHPQHHPLHHALHSLHHMLHKGTPVSAQIFVRLLQLCTHKDHLQVGRKLHLLITKSGWKTYSFLGNHLIRMFSSCGSLADATHVFRLLPRPNVYAWSAIISAHTKHGLHGHAIHLFNQMQHSCVDPDGHAFVAILKACSNQEDFTQGRLVHAHAVVLELDSNLHVGSSLIDMYSRCGSVKDAHSVFNGLPMQNAVTWSALISGHVLHECGREALKDFRRMLSNGLEPDKVTLVSMVKASSTIGDLNLSMVFHLYIIESGVESHTNIGNALVDMYSKHGSLTNARRVFDRLQNRDVVTWSSMIAGHAEHEHSEDALLLYWQMKEEGIEPNSTTFVCLIRVCSNNSALSHGKLIHGHILRSACTLDLFVGKALVDMYSKCGSPEDAYAVFAKLPERDLVTWNAMITGYAECGDYRLAKNLFEGMRKQGLKPNILTLLCLLGACSQEGLVEEGCCLFNSMKEDLQLTPGFDLYSCMVDVLGRAGCLVEAEDLLHTMPCQPEALMWMCMLSQCRTHGSMYMGQQSFGCVVADDGRHGSSYVLMLDMFSKAHLWNEARNIKELMISTNAWKKPGTACIKLDTEAYEFIVGDKNHPQSPDIYAELKRLQTRIKLEGYVP